MDLKKIFKRKPRPTYGGFIEWLDHRDPDEVVGKAGDPKHCPLAVYVRRLGYEHPYVAGHSIHYETFWAYHRLHDDWVGRVIRVSDGQGPAVRAGDLRRRLSAYGGK